MSKWKPRTIVQRLAVPVLLLVGTSSMFSCTMEDRPMLTTPTGVATRSEIPPIDAAAPTRVETATFAMG